MTSTQQQDGALPIGLKVIVGVLFAATLFVILWFADMVLLGGRYSNSIQYGKECDYPVSAPYKLVYSEAKKMWAVQLSPGEYLLKGKYQITTTNGRISEPTMFVDTCVAKAFLKTYIADQQPKVTDFK